MSLSRKKSLSAIQMPDFIASFLSSILELIAQIAILGQLKYMITITNKSFQVLIIIYRFLISLIIGDLNASHVAEPLWSRYPG
ncbi:hypothetical protein ACDX78_04615 [Virgibacillus oceani]